MLVSGPMSPAALITTPHDVHEDEEGEEVGDDKERDGDEYDRDGDDDAPSMVMRRTIHCETQSHSVH